MKRLVAIAALCLAALPLAAQPRVGLASPEKDGGWLAFGLGLGQPYGMAAAATANFGRTRLLQLGFHANTELNFFGRSASTNALHVGYGRSRVSYWDRSALAAGPAVVWGLGDAADTGSRFVTAGLVLSAQQMVTPIPELGIGLDAFVNVNPIRSGWGVALTFLFEANK